MVKFSIPAWDTEMFKLSERRDVLSAIILSLNVKLKYDVRGNYQ